MAGGKVEGNSAASGEPWLDDDHLKERENLERLAGDAELAAESSTGSRSCVAGWSDEFFS
jgi:hypothetical protein